MFRYFVFFISLLTLIACDKPAEAPAEKQVSAPLTTIYVNGDILTMNDSRPEVEALAVREGEIFAVGSRSEVEAAAGNNTELKDLNGQTLLPGFIDTHGHISAVMSFMAFENVASPPVGEIRNIADIQALLSQKTAETPAGEWVIGASYGITTLQDGLAGKPDLQILHKGAMQGDLYLDVVGFLFYPNAALLDNEFPYSPDYNNRFRVGGLKLSLDGSPQVISNLVSPTGVL